MTTSHPCLSKLGGVSAGGRSTTALAAKLLLCLSGSPIRYVADLSWCRQATVTGAWIGRHSHLPTALPSPAGHSRGAGLKKCAIDFLLGSLTHFSLSFKKKDRQGIK